MDNGIISIIASIIGSVASGFTIYLFKQFNGLQIQIAKLETEVENIEKHNINTNEVLKKLETDMSSVKLTLERLVTKLEVIN